MLIIARRSVVRFAADYVEAAKENEKPARIMARLRAAAPAFQNR
jgi:hypothetical protein